MNASAARVPTSIADAVREGMRRLSAHQEDGGDMETGRRDVRVATAWGEVWVTGRVVGRHVDLREVEVRGCPDSRQVREAGMKCINEWRHPWVCEPVRDVRMATARTA